MSSAGNFKINVWRGGYPVVCEISYEGEEICRIHHTELSDLKYAVKKAMQQARSELSKEDKDEV